MKFQYYKELNPQYDTIQQVLTNRGIELDKIEHYLSPDLNDLNDPELFGKDKLEAAKAFLKEAMDNNETIFLPQDADVDGITSTAIFCNYIAKLNEQYAKEHLDIYLHDGKVHGLADCYQRVIDKGYKYCWINDASSNDSEFIDKLLAAGCKCCITDHHESENPPKNCILINNQLSNYPNKNLSGAGVIWQVLRYFDMCEGTAYTKDLMDLAALGILSDVMDMRQQENRYIVSTGLRPENIHNPLIYEMWQANKFKLGDILTPVKVIWYITPLLNAVCRSGTLEEKQITINSMLTYRAFEQIESSGRGEKGQMVNTCIEGVRVVNRVKRVQTKQQEEGMERLDSIIKEKNLLNHKVLLIPLDKDDPMPATLRGLVASKLMSKYQRPCLVLTNFDKDGTSCYGGSGRGYNGWEIQNFKDKWYETGEIIESIGHQMAHGFVIEESHIPQFLDKTDKMFANESNEFIYKCDYIFDDKNIDENIIIDIGNLADIWASSPLGEPLIGLNHIKVRAENVTVMKEKHIKIIINGVQCVKFFATDLIEELKNNNPGYVIIDAIGKGSINEWAGNETPQIMLDNVEIIQKEEFEF